MIKRLVTVVLAVFGSFVLVATLHAQTTATILGTVLDESQAVLPGVTVTVTQVETGMSRTVVSGHDGRYNAPQLPLGSYQVRAELSGFQTVTHSGIVLTLGREAVVNLSLKVGEVTEQIEVTGEAPLINATSASLAALVDRQSIEVLPLNGRDITQLATLQPSVSMVTTKGSSPTAGQGTQISIAGARPNQNTFLMDGTDLTNNSGKGVGGVSGAFLGVDTVQEFTVQVGNYSAQYGRAAGGIINIVTRAGTNSTRGGAFYYHRNDALDARNYFDRDKPDFSRNQFGATLGGPLRRNRTFYFASYEGFRQSLGETTISFVPTAEARRGILPGGRTVAVDPAVQPLIALWPLPNGRIFGDGTGEYLTAGSETTRDDHASIRFDHTFSDKTSGFARYSITDGEKVLPFFGSAFGGYPLSMTSRNQYLSIQGTRILSPNLVAMARATGNASQYAGRCTADVEELRFYKGRPVGSVPVEAGVETLGCAFQQPFDHPVGVLDFGTDLTYNHGAHSIKTGASLKRYLWGFQRDSRNGILTYLTWEDLLRNNVYSFVGIQPGSSDTRRHYRQNTIGLYVQDDVQVRNRLTVNLGLRYEFITNPTEITTCPECNGMPRIAYIPQDWDVSHPVNGILTDKVFNKNPSLRNFSPRLGVAWVPTADGRTSIRAGWGVFFDTIYPLVYDNMRVPPLFNTLDLREGVKYPNPLDARARFQGLAPTAIDYYNEHTPRVQQFNIFVQREIWPATVVQVGYLGSRSKYLPVANDPNTREPQFLPDGRVFFPAGAPRRNPNWGTLRHLEWSGIASYDGGQLGLTRRFRGGFQAGANYTFSKTIDTGSATIGGDSATDDRARPNPFNVLSHKGLAAHHVAHIFSLNYALELPFGPGMRYGGALTGFAGKLLEGWGMQGILTLKSGPAFSVVMSGDRARSYTTGSQRPDLVAGASNNPILGGVDRYYDVTAFALPAAGYLGNLGKGTLTGPGLGTLDFSIVKNNRIGGSRLQLRLEMFNLLNRANFQVPGRTVMNASGVVPASAGRITQTSTTARQAQVAIRFTF